jgi:ABC-type nickel/cobalt efflux system permease component RcnA
MNFSTAAPLGIIVLGLLLGMRHATDPDHVVAVTTMLSRERRIGAATRIGLIWGMGHTVTVLLVGAAIIVFKLGVPVRLGLAMEFAVAIVLILLGVGAAGNLLRRGFNGLMRKHPQPIVHWHAHSHRNGTHGHPHVHQEVASGLEGSHSSNGEHEDHLSVRFLPGLATRHPLVRAFGVGLVHGLAGSAAIALLVLSAIPSPLWATIYLAIFCLGVIVGMGLITTAIGAPFIFAAQRLASFHQTLAFGSGLLSFGFGLFLAYQLGINDGLFTNNPIWIPH